MSEPIITEEVSEAKVHAKIDIWLKLAGGRGGKSFINSALNNFEPMTMRKLDKALDSMESKSEPSRRYESVGTSIDEVRLDDTTDDAFRYFMPERHYDSSNWSQTELKQTSNKPDWKQEPHERHRPAMQASPSSLISKLLSKPANTEIKAVPKPNKTVDKLKAKKLKHDKTDRGTW